jgi:hypothetical protein
MTTAVPIPLLARNIHGSERRWTTSSLATIGHNSFGADQATQPMDRSASVSRRMRIHVLAPMMGVCYLFQRSTDTQALVQRTKLDAQIVATACDGQSRASKNKQGHSLDGAGPQKMHEDGPSFRPWCVVLSPRYEGKAPRPSGTRSQ